MLNSISSTMSLITCTILLFIGLYVTVKLKFLFITHPKSIVRSLLEKDPESNISPFAAVTVALAGTLGVGNIVGVAAAIYYGGPGSIFWMWVGAFFSVLIKYCEIVLAVRYKKDDRHGQNNVSFAYMKPRFISCVFAFLCVIASFSIGNFLQMNSLSGILKEICNTPKIVCGTFVSVLLVILLRKDFKFISALTSLLIPLASLLYIIMCVCVIIDCIEYVPNAFYVIFNDAFHFEAGFGGIFAIIFSKAARFGIMRGLITNESGCGTAPLAHSEADTDSAVRQGFWGIFEVIADTFVLCSLSAIVIPTDPNKSFGSDIVYILERFTDTGGKAFMWILCGCIALFAFATLIGWSHYGLTSLLSLTKNKKIKQAYIIIYALLAVVGSIMTSTQMWNIADITVCIMTVINSIFIFIRFKEVKYETDLYFRPHGRGK